MSKAKASADSPNVATQPRPTDDCGRELDAFGLPLNGPARLRALAGQPDPIVEAVTSVVAVVADAIPTANDTKTEAVNG